MFTTALFVFWVLCLHRKACTEKQSDNLSHLLKSRIW